MRSKLLFGWVLMAVLFLLHAPALGQEQAHDAEQVRKDERVRIGALYVATVTGRRHLDGIKKAVAAHDLMRDGVEVVEMPYLPERKGVELLLEAMQEETLDLVLGPTDSGVFVRVLQRQEDLGQKVIPVISSLVVAGVGNEPDGWFFRTNLDVERRAGAIYDFLNKRWVNSITVLYSDTEFGRRAEDAFRKQLRGIQDENYAALPYTAPDVRTQLTEILANWPEAVGIFGEREDILASYRDLRSMNAQGTPYRPLLFTVLDIRLLAAEVEDFLFVSVISPEAARSSAVGAEEDDVFGLSYDTTKLVLDELHVATRGRGYDKTAFRDRIAHRMGGAGVGEGKHTGMRFANMANTSESFVYRLSGGAVVPMPSGNVGFQEKWWHKATMLWNRFGWWPLAVAFIMLMTVIATSTHDIYRWYGGSLTKLIWRRRFFSMHFLALVAIQGGVALGLFAFLGETGRIRYDSMLNAFVIALAPSPLLRTSFANIGGTNWGFADQYDKLLRYLTRQLLRARYPDRSRNIKVLAYYNSLRFLRRTLDDVYKALPNKEEAARLRASAKAGEEAQPSHFGKRTFLAERLVELRTWEDLCVLNCVPESMRASVEEDPDSLIFGCVNYCQHDSVREQKLTDGAAERVDRAGTAVQRHYATKLKEAEDGEDQRDKLFVAAQFLMMRFRFQKEDFQKLLVYPPDDQAAETAQVDPPKPDETVSTAQDQEARAETPGNGKNRIVGISYPEE